MSLRRDTLDLPVPVGHFLRYRNTEYPREFGLAAERSRGMLDSSEIVVGGEAGV
jgi:hypothetical protein